MKRAFTIAFATLIATATLTADSLFDQLSPEDFKAAGLNKLSEKELAHLEALLAELETEEMADPQTPSVAKANANNADLLGREQLTVETKNAPRKIESRLVGTFDGWDGGTLFELENGQIWQQRIDEKQKYTPKENPKVTVYKSFGGYRMRFEGYNQSCAVKRVR